MPNLETKQGVLNAIAALLGVAARPVARGSTEPKDAFLDVIDVLHLPIDRDQTKPALGKAIAEAAGLDWGREHDCLDTESGGGDTIKLAGLMRIREAVQMLRNAPATPGQIGKVHGRKYVPETPSKSATPAVFERDPEVYDRGSNAHKELQNRIASLLSARGIEPLRWSPAAGDPPFDVAWHVGPTLYLCEVKSATETNERHQVRIGLGQLLEYGARVDARGETDVVLVLALERSFAALHRRAAERAEIRLLAQPTLEHDLDHLLAPSAPR